jgi:hypothetical protein
MVASKFDLRAIRRVHGVESQALLFVVVTEAPGGVELTSQFVWAPRVTVAHAPNPDMAAQTAASLAILFMILSPSRQIFPRGD